MYTINHNPSLYLYRLLRLNEDLRRLRSEREDLKHSLEAAERRNHEYRQDANAGLQQAGNRGKDQSSEIHKLKQELESTRRELDETRLRYFCSFTYVYYVQMFLCIHIIYPIINDSVL